MLQFLTASFPLPFKARVVAIHSCYSNERRKSQRRRVSQTQSNSPSSDQKAAEFCCLTLSLGQYIRLPSFPSEEITQDSPVSLSLWGEGFYRPGPTTAHFISITHLTQPVNRLILTLQPCSSLPPISSATVLLNW